jgi:hypothetical protein
MCKEVEIGKKGGCPKIPPWYKTQLLYLGCSMEKKTRWYFLKLWQIMYLDITIQWCKFKKKWTMGTLLGYPGKPQKWSESHVTETWLWNSPVTLAFLGNPTVFPLFIFFLICIIEEFCYLKWTEFQNKCRGGSI